LGRIKVPYFDVNQQVKIVETLKKVDLTLENNRLKIKTSQSLQKSLINQIF
jgi:hypothetical protein